jgi:hypothetical protein
MGSSKADKGTSIGTSDMNVTQKIGAQGPLAQTLKGYDRWDVNEIKDPVKDGDKMIKGKGEVP